MALKANPGQIYKCQSPAISAASIQVIGGSTTIYGSNVTEIDPVTKKLIVPEGDDKWVELDTLDAGIHLIANLPEWFKFEGGDEIWIKMGIDPRIDTGE